MCNTTGKHREQEVAWPLIFDVATDALVVELSGALDGVMRNMGTYRFAKRVCLNTSNKEECVASFIKSWRGKRIIDVLYEIDKNFYRVVDYIEFFGVEIKSELVSASASIVRSP